MASMVLMGTVVAVALVVGRHEVGATTAFTHHSPSSSHIITTHQHHTPSLLHITIITHHIIIIRSTAVRALLLFRSAPITPQKYHATCDCCCCRCATYSRQPIYPASHIVLLHSSNHVFI
jgi:hypothetical protein